MIFGNPLTLRKQSIILFLRAAIETAHKVKIKEIEMYEIGAEVWFKGDPITITSEPYTLYGGEWQDGIGDSGKIVTVPTPAQEQKNVAAQQQAWQKQQAEFRRLRQHTKGKGD